MVFISYAQNFEGIILAQVFATVESGTDIDAGTQDPDVDLVTKPVCDRGRRGLNDEPLERYHAPGCRSSSVRSGKPPREGGRQMAPR